MGGGIAFLSKKAFNPSNISNQKIVWKAEQIANQERKRFAEREKQLSIERDHEEFAKASGNKTELGRSTLSFMYDIPPGLNEKSDHRKSYDMVFEGDHSSFKNEASNPKSSIKRDNFFIRKDNDDDAAAAFREMFANTTNCNETSKPYLNNFSSADSNIETNKLLLTGINPNNQLAKKIKHVEHSNKDNLTPLEKAVGRKEDASRGAMKYARQIERFPQLRNAPLEITKKGHDIAHIASMSIRFKPLGAQIRNVRCIACGVWGHGLGDRECSINGWDPFSQNHILCLSQPSNSILKQKDNIQIQNESLIRSISSSSYQHNEYEKYLTFKNNYRTLDIKTVKDKKKLRKKSKKNKKYTVMLRK